MIVFETQDQKDFVVQCVQRAAVDVPHARFAAEVFEAVQLAAVVPTPPKNAEV